MSATSNRDDQDRVVITGITGTDVTFSPALSFDHLAEEYISNLTKNVFVGSFEETSPAYIRVDLNTNLQGIKNLVNVRFDHISNSAVNNQRFGLGFSSGTSTTQNPFNSFRDCTFYSRSGANSFRCLSIVLKDNYI